MDVKANYSPKTTSQSENLLMDCFYRVMEVKGFQESKIDYLVVCEILDPSGIYWVDQEFMMTTYEYQLDYF